MVKTVKTKSTISDKPVIDLYGIDGKAYDKVAVPTDIFKIKGNDKLTAQSLRVYMANQRQGTASTKTRSEVIGSTRKIYRQKGTGRARHGSIKAPIFVGGGIVGGPRPKDYSLKINQRMKRKAMFGALSMKLNADQIIGINDEALKTAKKTKEVHAFLKAVNPKNKNTLFVLTAKDSFFSRAAANIPYVSITDPQTLNIFSILKNQLIVFSKNSLEKIEESFMKNQK